MPNTADFPIDCTGDVCVGDIILFSERVNNTNRMRRVVAKVLKESYGLDKQQHTFSIQVLESSGYIPLTVGEKTTRKGRVIYRFYTRRKPWASEIRRSLVLDEKHRRGHRARLQRDVRKGIR